MKPASAERRPGPTAGDALGRFLGLEWIDPRTARLRIRPEVVHGGGMLLGPVVFALVDYSMASALWAETTVDEEIATTSVAITYIGSATTGEVTVAAEVERRTRRMASMRAAVHRDDGNLLASAVGTFQIFPASRSAERRADAADGTNEGQR